MDERSAPAWAGAPEPNSIDNGEGLPSGFVTFVLTDIEGSTRLLRRLPDVAPDLFDRHDVILRSAWQAHNGHEVSTEGDSFFVAFSDTGDAAAACAHAQSLLHSEPWPDGAAVKVRMGIHAGLAVPRGDNYIAFAIHQAARISAAAHGGQVLVTDTVKQRLSTVDRIRLEPLGRYRVRDFDDPELLYRIDIDGVDATKKPIRATPAEGHNLVRLLTSFYGRGDDVDAVSALLAPGRAVTLAGPGGIGKTRLAIEVGLEVAGEWSDGVWFVELADLTDSALVPEAVARSIGASSGDSATRWDDVIAHLAERNILVVLDNIETHLDICLTLVPDLLVRCPNAAVLMTSREPLKIQGESVYRVAPLAGPSADDDRSRIEQSPAVRLFCDRARLADPSFAIDSGNAEQVATVCAHLDGLPLALEIAAARVGVLSLDEISNGLDDRFRLLKSKDRSIPERHRTMEGLLDWSYRLLEPDERAALRQLAIFGGSFSVDATTVALAGSGIEADSIAELVWALVDKSLVVADIADSETRYRLPETVHQYARRLLEIAGEATATASRLASWLLEQVGPWLTADRQWIGRVAIELPNVRSVVGHLSAADPQTAQQLACVIGRYHEVVQSFATGIDELHRLNAVLQARTPTRVALLTSLADLHLRRADLDEARDLLDEASAIQAEVGPPDWASGSVERTRGEVEIRAGNIGAAKAIAEVALESELPISGQARMWSLLGVAHYSSNEIVEAARAFERELEAYTTLGQEANLASAHGNVAEVSMQLGDLVSAARHQRESLDLALALGLPVMVAYSCILASRLASRAGDWDVAVRLQASADVALESTGHELYATDREAVVQFLADARANVGDDIFEAEIRVGRALDLVAVAALATEVLSATAQPEITNRPGSPAAT